MKINLRTLCFILGVLVLAVPQTVKAQEDTTAEETVGSILEEEAPAQSIDGKVASVNLEEGYLVLEHPAADMAEENESSVFYFAPEAVISQNGETLTSADVAAGQSVSVTYTTDAEDKNTIQALEIVL